MGCHWDVGIIPSPELIALVESDLLLEKETTGKRSSIVTDLAIDMATENGIATESETERGTGIVTKRGTGSGTGTGTGTGIEIAIAGMTVTAERNGNLPIDLIRPSPRVAQQKIVSHPVDRTSPDHTPRMATNHSGSGEGPRKTRCALVLSSPVISFTHATYCAFSKSDRVSKRSSRKDNRDDRRRTSDKEGHERTREPDRRRKDRDGSDGDARGGDKVRSVPRKALFHPDLWSA
jgi:hypothetical protein